MAKPRKPPAPKPAPPKTHARPTRRSAIAVVPGGFEAALGNRRLRNFQPSGLHINALVQASGKDITARARYLRRNNGYAAIAPDIWTAASVGAGITPRLTVGSREFRKAVQKLWFDWTDESDADGVTDFYGQQRRVSDEEFVAGESFVRFRPRRLSDGLTVPLQLQILPSEMLTQGPVLTAGQGRDIRQGIEFDRIGRRSAYHFYRRNPNDPALSSQALDQTIVPASEVMHVYDAKDGGQIRGVSRYSAAIVKVFLLDAYDDAELDRKKTAAMFAGFITTRAPTDPFDDNEELTALGDRVLDLQPGTMQVLDPGEDVTFSEPADSGSSYEPFQYRTILQICAALGVPYAPLTGDLTKGNYGSNRGGVIEFKRRVEAFQNACMIFQFCRPVWRTWCEYAVLSGALTLETGVTLRDLQRGVRWLTPRWDWLDPLKDANAEKAQIETGLKSRTAALAERGLDIEEVDAEIAEERARAKELGLVFDFRSPGDLTKIGDNAIRVEDAQDDEGDAPIKKDSTT